MSSGRNSGIFGAAVGVLVPCLVLAACGNSKPLTRAEFIKQGNEICEATTKERGEATKEFAQEASGGANEREEGANALLEPVQKMTEELAGLSPPEAEEKTAEAIVRAFEAGAAKVEAEPAGKNTASAFGRANQLAAEAGLTACSV